MRFPESQVDSAISALRACAGPTRAKRSCLTCHIGRDAEEEGVVRYYEEWDTEESLSKHLRSEDFRKVLFVLDLCVEEPRVTVGETASTGGVEVLRSLKNGGAPAG